MAALSEKSVKSEFVRALAARPGSFSFFAAVRRLEQLCPDAARVGVLAAGKEPVVRFAQVPRLYFPPSELFDYTPGGEGAGTLQVYFFGLFGPGGALPPALTDYVHTRGRHFYDLAMQRFADMFHDRLIALFYRAGTRSEAAVSYDRAEDPLGASMAALAGVPEGGAGASLPSKAPVSFFRELLGRNRPGPLLRALERFFGFPVVLKQGVPCHLKIEEENRCCLGMSAGTCTLGQTSLLGERQRTVSEKVAVEVGPVDYTAFSGFLPGRSGFRRLKAWLHLMSNRPLLWELRFSVPTATVPFLSLDGSQALGCNACLPDVSCGTTCYTLTCDI